MKRKGIPIYAWSPDLRLLHKWEDSKEAAVFLHKRQRVVDALADQNQTVNGMLITRSGDPMAVALMCMEERIAPGTVEVYEMVPVLRFRARSCSEAARMIGCNTSRVNDAVRNNGTLDKRWQFKVIETGIPPGA